MTLAEEITCARKTIVSDGYDMSVGELMSLYNEGELIINPNFQRLFRWNISQKTKFIESILLSLPLPPIFVFQAESGVWELIDGLQRLATIFEFAGILKNEDNSNSKPSILNGTKYLPSLANKSWNDLQSCGGESIGKVQQLEIKRARLRVEILKRESDDSAKYELFQRLNTGGAILSPQEVRNCVAIMIDKTFYEWLVVCSKNTNFLLTTNQTQNALEKQASLELIVRFFTFRNVKYTSGLDVNEYLDNALPFLAKEMDKEKEYNIFCATFELIYAAMGKDAFKKWNGVKFSGKFLMSMFEVVSIGISLHIEKYKDMPRDTSNSLIKDKCIALWKNEIFLHNSGAGVRGTTRLLNLLPLAATFFEHD